jgi:16S rRNA (guanine(966)-N(2))-methyltransferase RsmD
VFSALNARDLVRDAVVLDLYAGSGALGIEALSRGAAAATFVERDRDAAAAIRANLATCGFVATVVESDVARFLHTDTAGRAVRSRSETVDLAFVDPPYDMSDDELRPVLAAAARRAPGGLIVVERPRRPHRPRHVTTARPRLDRAADLPPDSDASADLLPDWRTSWTRTFGDTLVVFWTPAAADDESRDTPTRSPARRGDG